MNSLGKVLAVFALGLIAGALILGFRPVTSDAGYDCGSAFRESANIDRDELRAALRGNESESGCDQARSDAQTVPIVLGVLGVAALGAAAVTARPGRPSGERRTPAAP